jgi:hypothetical protein
LKGYRNFLEKSYKDDLFLHIVLCDDVVHPVKSSPSIIFIQNCKTEQIYPIVIDHQDSPSVIGLPEFIDNISKFDGRLFVLDKKSFIQQIPIKKVLDMNLGLHLKNDKIINIVEFETPAHRFIRQNYYTYPVLNKVVPLVKHQEMVSNLYFKNKSLYKSLIFNEIYFLSINNLIIEALSETEQHGIFVDREKFIKHFEVSPDKDNFVYSQYNIYTSTGRPSNRFGGVNYSALNKEDGSRECFVSRFGTEGTIVLIDYSAFHPRIICELTNFKLGLDVDFYRYIAKLCFKKQIIDEQDVSDAKALTFRQLYGGVEEEYSHIQFFYNLKGFIDSHWKEYQEQGYTSTPIFGLKISEIREPNKLFNYILQATETEIAVPILNKVNEFLRDKKSKTVLYTYDSILFDVHNSELGKIKKDVVEIMMDGNRFPIKCYIGKSYADLSQISL